MHYLARLNSQVAFRLPALSNNKCLPWQSKGLRSENLQEFQAQFQE